MIISTIKKFDENIILLKTIKQQNKKTIIVLVSNNIHEAIKLYVQCTNIVIFHQLILMIKT